MRCLGHAARFGMKCHVAVVDAFGECISGCGLGDDFLRHLAERHQNVIAVGAKLHALLRDEAVERRAVVGVKLGLHLVVLGLAP